MPLAGANLLPVFVGVGALFGESYAQNRLEAAITVTVTLLSSLLALFNQNLSNSPPSYW